MFRFAVVAVAMVLAVPGQSPAIVNIWLSGADDIPPGSSFPANVNEVPVLEPYLAGTGTVYIWGRPDTDKSLVNISLNLVAETQPLCTGCTPPNAIAFTSATMFNPSFAGVRRFEYVDNSTALTANRVEGMEGFQIFNEGTPAVGIGSTGDTLYDATNTSWLIAQVNYNVLATGENSDTHLFLEIGRIGMNHADDETDEHSVKFGDAFDTERTDVVMLVDDVPTHVNRDIHWGNYDAIIRPRPLPGDANRNGAVESNDYGVWRANFGSTMQLAADHNGNGIVDGPDYVIWRNNLGLTAGSGGAVVVPEPAAVVSALIAMLALWTLCRPSVGRAK